MTRAVQHENPFTARKREWIYPLLAALLGHLLVFLLFKFNLSTQPVWAVPAGNVIVLSLTTLPPDGAPALQAVPSAAVAPIPSVPKKVKAVVKKRKATTASSASEPSPVAPPAVTEDAPSDAATGEEANGAAAEGAFQDPKAAPSQGVVTGGGAIQASVPLYEQNPVPVYPDAARRRNSQGTVLLDVLVDPQGRAAQVKMHQSSGFAMLDRSALNAVRQWRFEPARRLGQAVEMWVRVPVRFELK
ncbi:MAG: energy transducer TonB [Desulfobacteraceae bacterium]|nr:energy transducer TonB [Desulfobacteraceae bacterium]